jgi:hypothetical protein
MMHSEAEEAYKSFMLQQEKETQAYKSFMLQQEKETLKASCQKMKDMDDLNVTLDDASKEIKRLQVELEHCSRRSSILSRVWSTKRPAGAMRLVASSP